MSPPRVTTPPTDLQLHVLRHLHAVAIRLDRGVLAHEVASSAERWTKDRYGREMPNGAWAHSHLSGLVRKGLVRTRKSHGARWYALTNEGVQYLEAMDVGSH